jgi:hypothetical protein
MEKNSKLFEEKMKRLNKFQIQNEENNSEINYQNDTKRKFIQNENENNQRYNYNDLLN